MTTHRAITAKRIRFGSLAELVFTGTATLVMPLSVLFGVLSLFGAKTVHLNGQSVTGLLGLVLSLFYSVILTLIFGMFALAATYVGVRVVGHFRPWKIEYIEPPSEAFRDDGNPLKPSAPPQEKVPPNLSSPESSDS